MRVAARHATESDEQLALLYRSVVHVRDLQTVPGPVAQTIFREYTVGAQIIISCSQACYQAQQPPLVTLHFLSSQRITLPAVLVVVVQHIRYTEEEEERN